MANAYNPDTGEKLTQEKPPDPEPKGTQDDSKKPAPPTDISEGEHKDTPPGSTEGSSENPTQSALSKEAVSFLEGSSNSPLAIRAIKDFDYNEREAQLAEHWEYHDEEYSKHGYI